jgi:proliferating cell nuclear antigen
MEAELKDSELFKRIMDTVGSLMADVSIDFTPQGISIKAMDPANIAMILFESGKEMFTSFKVDKDTKLSVSLDDLNGILRLLKKGDKLKINDNGSKMNLDISGKTKLHFGIPLIDENYTAQKVPQLKFTAEVTLLSSVIKDAIKAGFLVDDSLYLTVDNQKFILSARSEEKEFSEDLYINDNKELFNVTSEGLTRSKYSIEYLTKFLNALDPEKPVKMSFSNNYPLRLDYDLDETVKLSFVLANRIE